MRTVNYIVIDEGIVTVKIGLLAHVFEKTTDAGGQMKHVGGFMFLENSLSFFIGSDI